MDKKGREVNDLPILFSWNCKWNYEYCRIMLRNVRYAILLKDAGTCLKMRKMSRLECLSIYIYIVLYCSSVHIKFARKVSLPHLEVFIVWNETHNLTVFVYKNGNIVLVGRTVLFWYLKLYSAFKIFWRTKFIERERERERVKNWSSKAKKIPIRHLYIRHYLLWCSTLWNSVYFVCVIYRRSITVFI
jgi:hypothetical protein